MSLVFINTMTDTFTPTNSFSTATWVWELCRRAAADGIAPWVISSDSPHAAYDWKNLILVPAPKKPASRIGTKLNNQFRHRFGWVHPGQWTWCRNVARVIRENNLDRFPLVLSNDVELAVILREHFPEAFILHHAHNENGTKERFRPRFRQAVTVATAVSDCTRRWNEAYYGFAEGRMKTLLNGVDLAVYRPADAPAAGVPIVNFHSRLDRNKGADIFLRAALRTAQTNNRFSVQLVGRKFNWQAPPDDNDREIDALCLQLRNLGVSVNRTGWITRHRLPAVLQQAHINVVSSRWAEPSARGALRRDGVRPGHRGIRRRGQRAGDRRWRKFVRE